MEIVDGEHLHADIAGLGLRPSIPAAIGRPIATIGRSVAAIRRSVATIRRPVATIRRPGLLGGGLIIIIATAGMQDEQ